MAAASGEAPEVPLHPLVNGNYESSYVKITNGNHVWYKKRYAGNNVQMDLSRWTDGPFQLKAGDEIETTVNVTQITSSEIRIRICDTAGTEKGNILNYVSTAGTYTRTITLSADVELSSLKSYWKSGAASAIFEYDIIMYVNGVRWI